MVNFLLKRSVRIEISTLLLKQVKSLGTAIVSQAFYFFIGGYKVSRSLRKNITATQHDSQPPQSPLLPLRGMRDVLFINLHALKG